LKNNKLKNINIYFNIIPNIRMEATTIYNIAAVSFGVTIVIVGIYFHRRGLEEAEVEESYSYADLLS
jgi:hypothetical protein